jgi:hypothetical protein
MDKNGEKFRVFGDTVFSLLGTTKLFGYSGMIRIIVPFWITRELPEKIQIMDRILFSIQLNV